MWKTNGTHIILDIYHADMTCFNSIDLDSFLSKLISKHWLTVLGSLCHIFDKKNNSFTSCVSLAESHMSIHTWPETHYISVDIFVSNYSFDNSSKAYAIKDELVSFLDNWNLDVKERIIIR